jgi:hypothetical protein
MLSVSLEVSMGTEDTNNDYQQQYSTGASRIIEEPSPFWPQYIISLFFRPSSFFSTQLALGKYPYVIIVTWCYGISNIIERIDNELFREEMGNARIVWDEIGLPITESWINFWVLVLVTGAVSALFIWWIGGWWYGLRLRWSGAREPDQKLARLLFVYSSFVYTGPSVLLVLVSTLLYENYLQAYSSDSLYPSLLIVFPFWSIITSYKGVHTLFKVSTWMSLIWFLILPFLYYMLILGIFTFLFLSQSG